MSTTRLAIIQRIADTLGLRRTGQVTSSGLSSTATAFADTVNRFEGDDYWNEGYVITTAPTSLAGLEFRISDFANGTQTLTFYTSSGGLGTALTTAVTYDLYRPPVEPYEYRSAIRAAASKLAARGVTRRALDMTLQTTLGQQYAMPSAIDVQLTEVQMQSVELIANNLWIDGSSGWTLDAGGSLTNDGTGGARTLRQAGPLSVPYNNHPTDIAVNPHESFEFSAMIKTNGIIASWRYLFYDTTGAAIGNAATVIGTGVSTTGFTLQSGTFTAPANAATLRIHFATTPVGDVYSEAPNLMRYGQWERLSDWKTEYNGETAYLILSEKPPRGRRLKLIGRRTLESLTSDSDTLSMDEPEIAALAELACAEAYRQFGVRLGLDSTALQTEIDRHEGEYRKLIGPLSGAWRRTRYPNIPTFSSGH